MDTLPAIEQHHSCLFPHQSPAARARGCIFDTRPSLLNPLVNV